LVKRRGIELEIFSVGISKEASMLTTCENLAALLAFERDCVAEHWGNVRRAGGVSGGELETEAFINQHAKRMRQVYCQAICTWRTECELCRDRRTAQKLAVA
jgi:hypothetical protein